MSRQTPTELTAEERAMLVGEQLSSVTFVQDYLQLDFDGVQLTFNVWPAVLIAGEERVFGAPEYRDALCSLIAHVVSGVVIDESRLEVRFGTGERIYCDLASHRDIEGDRVILSRADDRYWNSW